MHYGRVSGAAQSQRVATDREVVNRCVAGDRAAQRALFDREIDRVHAILYRLVGPSSELEDLAQEAFTEVFRSLSSFRGDARLSTWIARVTAHVAYRHFASKRPTPASLDAVAEPAAGAVPADEQMGARRALHRVYALMAELEPAVRIAFSLHVLDGRSLEEVAAMMDASLVATKSRVWRARRRLRRDPDVCALLDGPGGEEQTP